VITRRIAEQLTSADEAADAKFGFIVRGFPFNTNQALLLDRYLNGVNLAIHLKNPSDAADYATSVRPLLDYYDERVPSLALRAPSSNSRTAERTNSPKSKRPSTKSKPESNVQSDIKGSQHPNHYLPYHSYKFPLSRCIDIMFCVNNFIPQRCSSAIPTKPSSIAATPKEERSNRP
jgi:adenylate kinase family enzyme